MESLDMTAQNIDKIAALFPNCITETTGEDGKLKRAINFDSLRQMLSSDVIEGDEAYEFTWVGKKAAIVEANKPIRKTLRPCPEESRDWDTTENLYIEGDNLEVLKLLQESYLNSVKLIYIDPPYNTGNDFIYRDDFKQTADEYDEDSGVYDDDGNRLFKNTDTNGRFHSDWCSMIYARLMLARNLLSDDGVIFISIDENEVDNLKKICNEVFNETNYAGEIIWKNSSKNDQAYISIQHEYIICYVKNKQVNTGEWVEAKEGTDEIFKAFDGFRKKFGNDWKAIHKAALDWYKQFPPTNPIYASKHYSWMDERGVYFPDNISGPNAGQYVYDVVHPVTGKICKAPSSGWRFPEETLLKKIKEGLIHFGDDETTVPNKKTYLKDTLYQSLGSVKYQDGRVASKQLTSLMGGNYFTNPKDVSIIRWLISAVGISDDDIVMDFFAGSASTAHAVMEYNTQKNVNCHFIMVQIQEDLDVTLSAATGGSKAVVCDSIKHLDSLNKPHFITEISKERILRAGDKIKEESPLTTQDLDTGFRVLKLDDSNMNDVYYSPNDYSQGMLSMLESNVKSDRNDLDLLFGCLLDWGLPLSLPYSSEQIDGCTVHNYNDGDLIACFDENVPDSVIKEIAKKQPLRAVFRDSSFANSPSKINVGEIFKLMAPDTSVKVI
jgi:adenine-specific DNA-methyltransferase